MAGEGRQGEIELEIAVFVLEAGLLFEGAVEDAVIESFVHGAGTGGDGADEWIWGLGIAVLERRIVADEAVGAADEYIVGGRFRIKSVGLN